MSTQNKDEAEKKKEYIKGLSRTNFMLWETIERRTVFRSMRHTLIRLRISLIVPMNSAEITDRYCKAYGDASIEVLEKNPNECI